MPEGLGRELDLGLGLGNEAPPLPWLLLPELWVTGEGLWPEPPWEVELCE